MTARIKLLNAVVPPVISGLLGLALGYFWFSPSQVSVTPEAEREYTIAQEMKFYEADKAEFEGSCVAGMVKALPSGRVASCSPEGKWGDPDAGIKVKVESFTVAPMECPPERPDCVYGIDFPRLFEALERGDVTFPPELRAPTGQSPVNLTEAERLQAVFGAKLVAKVVKEMEEAQGISYDEEQLPAVLNSPAFAEMLKREIRSQDKYGFCSDPESATCTFGTNESDYK